LYDVETGGRSRVTTGASDITPGWLDSERIVFVRLDNEPVLVTKRIGAGGDERVLARPARFPQTTANGRRVVFNLLFESQRMWEVAWIDVDRPSEIRRLGPPHVGARFPSVSPDGSLVAYVSAEVGRDEIFLTRLPSGEGKWQVSTEGGGWARFSPRGDAVVYRAPDGGFMSVPIRGNGDMKIGTPQKLFDWGATWLPFFDLASDGRRGVAAVGVGKSLAGPSLSIVQHWHREFEKK
jgi:hypothetical protein